jgi:hypothetical protein
LPFEQIRFGRRKGARIDWRLFAALTLTLSLYNFSHLGVGACDTLQPAGKIAKRVGGHWNPDRFPIRCIGQPTKLPAISRRLSFLSMVDAPVLY